MEEWRDIAGFDEYQVSNTGNVKSIKYGKERILKVFNINGYQYVHLCRDGEKPKNMLVHRLVAQAFLPNPDNLQDVNHKDENKTNNNVNNLEWCDRKYNINFGTRNERAAKAKSKAVRCIETGVIYASTMEVQRELGFAQQSICNCCNGKQYNKTCGGYHWEWHVA